MKNFDRYIEERKQLRKEFTLYGETFYLPPTLAYEAVLQFKALGMRDKNENVNDLEVLDLFSAIFGENTLTRIRELDTENTFDIDLASELMRWALHEYGVTATEANNEGKNDPKGTKKR